MNAFSLQANRSLQRKALLRLNSINQPNICARNDSVLLSNTGDGFKGALDLPATCVTRDFKKLIMFKRRIGDPASMKLSANWQRLAIRSSEYAPYICVHIPNSTFFTSSATSWADYQLWICQYNCRSIRNDFAFKLTITGANRKHSHFI